MRHLFQEGNTYGFKKGDTPWIKGKTKETSLQIAKYAEKYKGEGNPFYGKHHSEESKRKISEFGKNNHHSGQFKKGQIPWNKGKPYLAFIGKNNPNWKGGITELRKKIRGSLQYKSFRYNIFKRDKFECLYCSQIGGKLEMHHIKPYSVIVKENNIKTMEDAIKCQELWDKDNCITLCEECHKKTDSYLKQRGESL